MLLIPASGNASQDIWVALLTASAVCRPKRSITSGDTLPLVWLDSSGASSTVEEVLTDWPCLALVEGILLTRRAYRGSSFKD